MDESETKNEKPQNERRLDPELLKKGLRRDLDQCEMLKRCSDNKDMTEWNKRRKERPSEDVLLQGADFIKYNLKRVRFDVGDYKDKNTGESRYPRANVYLEGAYFYETNLEKSMFYDARLEGTKFYLTNLKGAVLQGAIVNSSTLFWKCKVNRYSKNGKCTNFTGVPLDAMRVDPGTKQLLEYNIRRMNWEEWYPKQHWSLRWLVRKFWEISDYGISTKQIIYTFFQLAVIFAGIYLAWGLVDYYLLGIEDNPGILSDLFVLERDQESVPDYLVPFRAVYFSIVTMTTLGFGDMYANAHSFVRGLFGHVLLALQVILGYVLLGALVTRFAVLFTAGGPAGKFADEK